MDCFQDNILHQIDKRLERRNRRQSEKLFAWIGILDALGWKVALRLPGRSPVFLSESASLWIRDRSGNDSSWSDILACLSESSEAWRLVNSCTLQLWTDDPLKSRDCKKSVHTGDLAPSGDRASPALTPRETEVVSWLQEGKTGPEISVILGISTRTVESHILRIYRKLGLHRRLQLMFPQDRTALLE